MTPQQRPQKRCDHNLLIAGLAVFSAIIEFMKLRIRGNSIRLRLTKGEIDRLGETGKVEESVEFSVGSPGFGYELFTSAGDEDLNARFNDNCLRISVPAQDAENWIRSEHVGIETTQQIGDGRTLRILVEKDFECLAERTGEDESDMFPNPAAVRK